VERVASVAGSSKVADDTVGLPPPELHPQRRTARLALAVAVLAVIGLLVRFATDGPSSIPATTSTAPASGAATTSPASASGAAPGAPIADSLAPSPPGDVSVLATSHGVVVDWHDAEDETELAGYEIRRDDVVLTTVDAATLQYVDADVQPGSDYRYTVVAFDRAGNRSLPSAPLVATAIATS